MSKSKIFSSLSYSKYNFIILLFVTLIALAPVVYYGPIDHEEYLNTTISALLNARSLHDNRSFLLWSDNLGFGSPMPIGHDNSFNPLFWLWPVLSLSSIMGIFWLLFTWLGSIYFARLLRSFSISGAMFYAAVVSYIFSMPYLTFVYKNDWPTLFFNWAMFPVWFYYAFMLVEKHHITKPAFATVRLGLVVGICFINAHFGYLSVLLTSAGLVIFLLALKKPKSLLYLSGAGILAVVIGAANMGYVMSEVALFPKGILRFAENGYSLRQILSAFVQPFSLEWLLHPKLHADIDYIWNSFLAVNDNVRVLAFGAVFMAAAVVSSFSAIVHQDWKKISLAVGFAFAITMSLLNPDDLYGIPSGTWLFRDMAVFFGIILAANFLQLLPKRNLLAVLQVVTVFLLAVPSLYYSSGARSYYRDAETPTPLMQEMIEKAAGQEQRIYFAPHIEKYLSRGRNGILNDPLELALFGFSPVNGWFKGVSQDIFFPSASLMHGFIRGNKATLENQPLLDLLGIELIVADDDDLPANQNLGELWNKKLEDGTIIHLLRNKTAWKRAWLMDIAAQNIKVKQMEGCSIKGFLCADVGELAATKLPYDVTISGGNGNMQATFLPDKIEMLLVFSSLYRKDWQAYSGSRKLDVIALADALLAVKIPADVAEVSLKYQPELRATLRIVSMVCFCACLAFLFISAIVRRKPIENAA